MTDDTFKLFVVGVASSILAAIIVNSFKEKKRGCGCAGNGGSGQTTSNYRPGNFQTPGRPVSMPTPYKGPR